MQTQTEIQFAEALRAIESPSLEAEERAQMLMEIAMGLQVKPQYPDQLRDAVTLYRRALAELPASAVLLEARIRARMGTALRAVPDGGAAALRQACECYRCALPTLYAQGRPEEAAETELNHGLAIQDAARLGTALLQDAIDCYHRALLVFKRESHPQEFAALHNNLATAYLSLPGTDERSKMREALVTQSFEEVLKVINLIDQPAEYAMIQNNLGNALQYISGSRTPENGLRALHAYDEALKVRNPRDTPAEYADTIANKANVLRNLPADAVNGNGVPSHMEAIQLYQEAIALFEQSGLHDRAELLAASIADIEQETDLPAKYKIAH